MKTQEIISSGKLELYVAGALSEREMIEMAVGAEEYPVIAQEIEKIEWALCAYLSAQSATMDRAEQGKQISQILEKIHAQGAPSVNPVLSPIKAVPSSPRVVKTSFRIRPLAMAAISIGFIVMTGTAIWLGLQNKHLSGEMTYMKDYQQKIVQQDQQLQGHYASMQQQFTVMRNILTKRVELKTVAGSKITGQENYMLVYWNPATQKLLLADANLPGLTKDQQYQLWALYNGKPVDAGVFDYNDKNINVSFQKDIPHAQAFAVTVEPKGGSKSPTMGNLCMMAKL